MVTKMRGSASPAVLTEKDRLLKWAGRRYRDYRLAGLLKAESRLANLKRRHRVMELNQDRLIPTGGAERRRAKAHRNRGLCLAPYGENRCHRDAQQGSYYCDTHQPVPA
jgi:hypothetical protein